MSIDPVEFGRVIGHLEAIERELADLKSRTIWRLDNLEMRVEKLETTDVDAAPAISLVKKGAWGFLSLAGAAAVARLFGWV